MPLTLPLRTVLLFAACAVAATASAQAPPLVSGDPFTGAYAVPTGEPIDLSAGAPRVATLPQFSTGPMTAGNSVFMAPQIVGGPGGCSTCGPGGAAPAMPYGAMSPAFAAPSMAPAGPGLGVPLGAGQGSETIYPGYVDPMADIPAGRGFGGCGCGTPGLPPVLTPPGGGYGGQRCGWAAGFTWVFLKPFYSGNNAFSVSTPTGSGLNTSTQSFNYSLDLSPRVFVEWVSRNDFGFRATWFSFDNSADNATGSVALPGFIQRPISSTKYPGGRISAGSNISLNTIDFDLSQRMRVQRSLINLGGGLRWANYENSYTSTITSPVYGSALGNASRQFNGFGPTLFAEWRRPIANTRFSLLAKVRGSMLYGDSKTTSYQQDPLGNTRSFSSDTNDFVGVGETQLGFEWSTWICRRSVLFVQTAFEGQYWMGVGTAFDRNDDLGLVGLNTTVGLEW